MEKYTIRKKMRVQVGELGETKQASEKTNRKESPNKRTQHGIHIQETLEVVSDSCPKTHVQKLKINKLINRRLQQLIQEAKGMLPL